MADQTYLMLTDARHEKLKSRRKLHKPVRSALGKSKTYLDFCLGVADLNNYS